MKHMAGLLGLWALLLSLGAVVPAYAEDAFYRPAPGNQYVARTDKYLYVIWAIPNDLGPLAKGNAEAVEGLIARTAIFLCKEHLAADPNPATPCKMQVVRMSTNDEYTKSAAGGFKTVATLVLSKQHATASTLERASNMPVSQLKALFNKFSVQHERLSVQHSP